MRAEGMRRGNASDVLRAVVADGPLSRADIARRTGLSAPSVTKLTAVLVDAGLLSEQAPLETAQGRPRVPVRIDPRGPVALGIHIGLLRTTFGLVALDGTVLSQRVLDHAGDLDPRRIAEQAVTGAGGFLAERLGGRRLLGTGISLGGWVDGDAGTVVEHSVLGWSDVHLLELLDDRLPGPVVLDQNVRAAARAELWFGAGREVDDFVYIFFGNILGAAVVVDRSVHRGPGAAAGGIEHLPVSGVEGTACACCGAACLSAVASDAVLVERARVEGVLASGDAHLPLPLERLIAAARPAGTGSGDARAQQLLRTRAEFAGRAVATIADLLNPSRIVLAGGIVVADEYLPDLRAAVTGRVHRGWSADERIVTSTFGSGTLVVASAMPLLEGVYLDPLALVEDGGEREAAS
ncbi:ROK family transcriptional regulator [Streptomyces prunicolor]|uniref:ROK family transcriptional regulator n=1 Tax=Streptomyces prunicolor TaxID=67348 RepID=UPI00224C95CC|nr:ROK family transcriptional regulator [Streptomyces prunicolor]MCX5241196.1 ROK family transcriptional regulator [Streptomyces prunicolor]